MYGTYWCPHCQDQKAAFGSAFQYVKYVECTENIKECTDKQIAGVPTWIGPDGEHHEGFLELAKLAELSGCSLSASPQ